MKEMLTVLQILRYLLKLPLEFKYLTQKPFRNFLPSQYSMQLKAL